MTSDVAVVKGPRGHEPVFKALDLIDFKQAFSDKKKALIKINFICEKTWDTGATTDPIRKPSPYMVVLSMMTYG